MTKQAHITSRPGHQIGDRVLGLCGKDFKVKILWADIPVEKPICRACVDVAVAALTEADALIEAARLDSMLLNVRVGKLADTLDPEEATQLDEIAARDHEHQRAQEVRAELAADEERAKQTCTCTWTSPEIFTEDPDCPIHGGELDAIGVETPEIEDVQLPEPPEEV
jgi:hypothetical protein